MSSKKKAKRSEVELGCPVIAWLECEGWDVYQEVQRGYAGPVADIVATKGDIVAVVELKVSLTFDLLAQITRWTGYAHHLFVAVPHARSSDGRRMAERVFADRGVYVLEVHETSHAEQLRQGTIADRVKQQRATPTRLEAPHAATLHARLREEHKTHASAGSARGGHYTEFRGTCEKLAALVRARPGVSLRDAVAGIDHHYANAKSARSHLRQMVAKGVVAGVRVEGDENGIARLYPVEVS